MGDIPTPRSFQQILGDAIDAFRSKQGIKTLKVGSGVLSTLEAAAQSDVRGSQDTFDLLAAISIDSAEGLALERWGRDEQVSKIQERAASGKVTITDTSFDKLSTKLFQGAPAPIVGSVTINVVDASEWPASGNVYLGRGTSNYEGPLTYSSKSDAGTHWALTLSAGTTKFHNTSESAVLAQGGNRVIGAEVIVRTPQANVADAIEFRTLYAVTIADGEVTVSNVAVVAQTPGIIGNVAKGQIKEFSTLPFAGAEVTNPLPFSNGNDTERDDDYRERIKAAKKSRALGTPLALITAVTGITAPDENSRVSSASFVKRGSLPSTLYIDDGTGYEERVAGVAVESIVDSAIGGEQFLETTQRAIARAFAETNNSAPFTLMAGASLKVQVGGVTYVHPFETSEFVSLENATAYEIVASINANPDLAFLARTSASGSKVVLFAKVDTNEEIEVLAADGVDANDGLGFPGGVNYTMQLYKNDQLLSKDGKTAVYVSEPFSTWSPMTGTQSMVIAIDRTPFQTFAFTAQDFIDANTGFTSMGRNSIAAWAAVIKARIAGITATESAGRLVLTSNAGPVDNAGVYVAGGSVVAAGMFTSGAGYGRVRDYSVDRNEGQIVLERALSAGDRLSVGSKSTRAFVESDVIGTTTLVSAAKLWFVVDGSAEVVESGASGSTTYTIAVSALHDWGHMLTITGTGSPFANVLPGDWVILGDPALHASLRGAYRVADSSANYVTVERRSMLMSRLGHRSVALPPISTNLCKVLSTGGSIMNYSSLSISSFTAATDTCEIYDPNTKTVSAAAPMNQARTFHTATLLADGRVMVSGGFDENGTPLTSIELYDPTTDIWTVSGAVLSSGRGNHTATLLANDKVLFAGGGTGGNTFSTAAQLYTPGSDSIATTGSLNVARAHHRAIRLPSGTVLVVGGCGSGMAAANGLTSAELYSVGGGTFSSTGSMTRRRRDFGLALIGTSPTTVLAIGNRTGSLGEATYEVYSISGTTWGGEVTTPNNFVFGQKEAITRTDGKVLLLHGWNSGTNAPASATFDGTTWVPLAGNPVSTDSRAKFAAQYVTIQKADLSVSNRVAALGGAMEISTAPGFQPTSQIEEVTGDLIWTVPEAAIATSLSLPNVGLAFVRTDGLIRQIEVPAATNYTASSLVNVLNGGELPGAAATVYRTNRLRVATNTFALGGDIALVTQDNNSSNLQLESGSAVENSSSHAGSVESGNSELGTPSFDAARLFGVGQAAVDLEEPVISNALSSGVNPGYGLVGLRNFWAGEDGTSTYSYALAAAPYFRAGSNYGFRSRLLTMSGTVYTSTLLPRTAPIQPWMPLDRMYLAAPFAFTSSDSLSVLVDNDLSKRFSIQLGRKLQTVGSTYADTNTFKDADASGVSLARTFGLGYDFNDFAVHMASRAVAFSATANLRTLIRYTRLGPDGDGVRVRFSNPIEPLGTVAATLEYSDDVTTDIRIQLAGGASRSATVRAGTKVGTAMTSIGGTDEGRLVYALNLATSAASRTTNVTTLTLTLPSGITDHGLQVADVVWVTSNDVNFTAGLKTITARAATTISYAETAANATGGAIGTVSFDSSGEATFAGSGILVGDFFRVNASSGFTDTAFVNNTVRVTAIGAGNGYITSLSGENAGSSFAGVTTTLAWSSLALAESLVLFANPAQTATTITAAVNALSSVDNSTTPVTFKVLGSGIGTIDRSTPETLDDATAWYVLADGVNWVKTTTSPGSVAGDYTLTFKNVITGELATNSDWANEDVRLVPITTRNVVGWLNTPTVSGLFTACLVQASSDGTKVQIASRTLGALGGVQVQGGRANSATAAVVGASQFLGSGDIRSASTVRRSDTTGMNVGMWCAVENTLAVPKVSPFGSGSALLSWAADGTVHFNGGVQTYAEGFAPVNANVQFERQGRYVAISEMGLSGSGSFAGIVPGSFVRITEAASLTVGMSQVSAGNQGIFRVVRAVGAPVGFGTIWIERDGGEVEERSDCTLAVYTPDSVMPGDVFVVGTPIFGAANQGRWTVEQVGSPTGDDADQFTDNSYLKVSVEDKTPVVQGASATLGTSSVLVQIVEGTPAKFVMRIDGIAPNQTDGAFMDLRWDQTIGASVIGESAGSVVSVLDKLDFPLDFASGVDGYHYDVGLLGEANRVIYGEPSDTSTYPGVAAGGAKINIQGPLVKRVFVSLSIRIRSGVPNSDVADRVRSAVATVINRTPIGTAIALSDIVSAAGSCRGVLSVSVISPTYGAGNDRIPVQPFEKPLVLNLDQDIQISFAGE